MGQILQKQMSRVLYQQFSYKIRYKMDYYIFLAILLVVILLLVITIIFYHYAKHRLKNINMENNELKKIRI